MDRSETSDTYIFISEVVISKARNEFVYNGKLEESVLSELHANWIRKMIQAGVVNGTVERSSASIPTPTPLQTPDQNPLPGSAESGRSRSDPSMDLVMSIKNDIPQQDGANDGDTVAEQNTNAPPNDEDDEEILNEDDDDEEVDAIAIDEDTPHLVICQFDDVKKRTRSKRNKSKWMCNFKAGVMLINGKNIVFSEAVGDFDF